MGTWISLGIAVHGNRLTASIDGQMVAAVQDFTYDSGSVGLGSGFHYSAFDNITIKPLGLLPYGLAAFSSFTNGQLEWKESGWFGFAFTCTRNIDVTHLARY